MRTVGILTLTLFFFGCSKDAEDYKENWKEQKEALTTYQDKYSAFKTVLAADQKRAEGLWKEAEKAGDKKEKLEKMKVALEALGVLNKLKKIESKQSDIKTIVSRIKSTRVKGLKKVTARTAITNAHSSLSTVETHIENASDYEEVGLATAFLDRQLNMLENAHRRVQKAYKEIKPRTTRKKSKKNKKEKKK